MSPAFNFGIYSRSASSPLDEVNQGQDEEGGGHEAAAAGAAAVDLALELLLKGVRHGFIKQGFYIL